MFYVLMKKKRGNQEAKKFGLLNDSHVGLIGAGPITDC